MVSLASALALVAAAVVAWQPFVAFAPGMFSVVGSFVPASFAAAGATRIPGC